VTEFYNQKSIRIMTCCGTTRLSVSTLFHEVSLLFAYWIPERHTRWRDRSLSYGTHARRAYLQTGLLEGWGDEYTCNSVDALSQHVVLFVL